VAHFSGPLVTLGTWLQLPKCITDSQSVSPEEHDEMKVKTNMKAGSAMWGS
jgi:hypothetical protein